MPNRRGRPPGSATQLPSAIRDFSELPVILKIDDIARLLRRSVSTLRREQRLGTWDGPPPIYMKPLRWFREDVIRYLERKSAQAATRGTRRGMAASR